MLVTVYNIGMFSLDLFFNQILLFKGLRTLIIALNNIDLKKKKSSTLGYVGNLAQIVDTIFTTC